MIFLKSAVLQALPTLPRLPQWVWVAAYPIAHLAIGLILATGSTSGHADAQVDRVLRDFSIDLRGLEGQFEQQVFDADHRLKEASSGRVALAPPRLFRWEYEQPFPQLIVADGDHVWVHDPDLEQVTVRKQSLEEQQSPLAALIDPDELQRQFKVTREGDRDGLAWLRLQPRRDKDTAFIICRLGFDAGKLVRMDLEDQLAQRTEVRFHAWQRNPTFAQDTFRFVPPPGADVVGDVIESAEVFPVRE